MMPDGSRLHVGDPGHHPPAHGRQHPQVRRCGAHASTTWSRSARSPRQAARFLEAAVAAGLNILVSGGTQAGKTTLLNCLCAAIPARERVVTCEEVFELRVPLPDVVVDADPPAEPGGRRGDPAAPPGQGGAADAALPDHRRRGAAGGVPRPADRAELGAARHVHAARQQRPRGRGEDVHAAAAGRREHRDGVRRPHRRVQRRPGRARRHRRLRRTAGCARSSRCPAVSRTASSRPPTSSPRATARLVRADGYPPHADRFAARGFDLAALLGGGA